jgi:CspA family cold shock protein
MSENRVTGTVKWASPERGFGFIEHEGDTYAFIPYSELEAVGYRELIEGERVSFVVTQGQKGPQASQVRRVNTKR